MTKVFLSRMVFPAALEASDWLKVASAFPAHAKNEMSKEGFSYAHVGVANETIEDSLEEIASHLGEADFRADRGQTGRCQDIQDAKQHAQDIRAILLEPTYQDVSDGSWVSRTLWSSTVPRLCVVNGKRCWEMENVSQAFSEGLAADNAILFTKHSWEMGFDAHRCGKAEERARKCYQECVEAMGVQTVNLHGGCCA